MRMKRVIVLAVLMSLLAAMFPTPRQEARAAAKYYITVDLTNQVVTVYDNGNTKESGIVCQMICSTGKPGTPTPTGTYTLPSKRYSTERTEWYYFPEFNCYAKWATRIVGGILFHSVLYSASKSGPTSSSVKALGSKASHGCVRLRVPDAKWIAKNCPSGTRCRIYNSGKVNSTLRKKLLNKSFYRANETYDHFMGRDSGGDEDEGGGLPLSRGSQGDLVKQVQKRLKELGFLNDTVDGKFGPNTEAAVEYFQGAAGLKKTGVVDAALWARIFAVNAPTGTYVTLSKGMTGPAVAVLQAALTDLKVFEGSADGSFLKDTEDAVKDYQNYFGFSVNGKASQALQKDILKRAADVKARFGDSDYRLVVDTEEVRKAKIKGASTVQLRAKAKASAKSLAKLKKKTVVDVLSEGATWTKVAYGSKKGYIQTKYLSFYTERRPAPHYEAGDAPDPTPTPTPEIWLPTATPEISIPTASPTPSPTPEIFIPTALSGPSDDEEQGDAAGPEDDGEALEIDAGDESESDEAGLEPGAEAAPGAAEDILTLDDFQPEPVEEPNEPE